MINSLLIFSRLWGWHDCWWSPIKSTFRFWLVNPHEIPIGISPLLVINIYQYISYMFMYSIYIYISPYLTAWFLSTSHYITMKSIFIGVYTHHYLQIRHGVDDRKLYTSRSTWYTTPPWFKSPTPWWTWNKHHIFPKHIPIGPIGGCSCGYTKWHHHMVFSTPPKLGYKPYNCGYTLW